MTRQRRYKAPIIHDKTAPHVMCKCGHPRSEHRDALPAPCYCGRTSETIFRDDPGYGCLCIAFSPVNPSEIGKSVVIEKGRYLD